MNDTSIRTQKAREICLEMLTQRGCLIDESCEDKIIAVKSDNTRLIVFFTQTSKFNVKSIGLYISAMNDIKINHAILVYQNSITSATKKLIQNTHDMYFELFAEDDLQFNITKHELQPIFERVPDKEAEEIKHVVGSKFPILKKDDPIARFYDYRRGELIRVIRKSHRGKYTMYRIVK